MLDMWLARQTQEKVIPILQKVLEGAKEEFADAVANGGGVYAVGYCFGGKYVLLLGAELPDTVAKGQALKDEEQGMSKSDPQIKAGAIAHGMIHAMIWNPDTGLMNNRYHGYQRGCGSFEGTGDDGMYWYIGYKLPSLWELDADMRLSRE